MQKIARDILNRYRYMNVRLLYVPHRNIRFIFEAAMEEIGYIITL